MQQAAGASRDGKHSWRNKSPIHVDGPALGSVATTILLRAAKRLAACKDVGGTLRTHRTPAKPGGADKAVPTAHVSNLENRLRERLGTKVHLRYAQGKGSLEIAFFSDEELERILQILGISPD